MIVQSFTVYIFSFILSFSWFLLLEAAVIPQCQPPNNCSVHVFRVRLSQKPESEDDDIPENATIVSVVQRKKYGSNYFEIKGGTEMTEKLTKEIMQNMPENTDPRLMEKISKNDFYLKPVIGLEGLVLTATIPPPPVRTRNHQTTSSPINTPDSFPVLQIALLLCIGIILGILFTAICLFMADFRKEPKFDRTNAVTFKKSIENPPERRPMLRREEQIEMMKRAREAHPTPTATHSQASSVRLAPTSSRSQFNSSHRV